MQRALRLAALQKGRTADNPAVGCVLVKDGTIIGRGVTGDGGRPHGEVLALRHAAADPRGATAYVTLEPCAHHGRSGPCADALIKAGITRCVIAVRDPFPQVNGQGIARMEAAGITVETGLGEAHARGLMAEFLGRFD